MANNYASVPLPLEGKKISFRIVYQIMRNIKAYSEVKNIEVKKKVYSLDFDFQIQGNEFIAPMKDTDQSEPPTPVWPTVSSVIDEFQALVDKVTPLLGKNVQITNLLFSTPNASIPVPLYKFGSSPRKAAPPDTVLFFVLQPIYKETSYRLYVKGVSLDFFNVPLSDTELRIIADFERLFTDQLVLFDGK